RLSIRGSLIRSPFGIRNVKVYWNDIPLTDAGGGTYLNLLDFNNRGSIEVIKGPGGSLYGAGTGGVVLLKSPVAFRGFRSQISTVAGSYGLFNLNGSVGVGSEKANTTAMFSHQQSEGYRKQSQMERKVFNVQSQLFVSKHRTLNINGLYADLYYQTPGGLTRPQADADPTQARPAAGISLSAETQQAAVFNKTFNLALSQEYDFDEHWTNKTAVYGTFTQFENPAIRNYEKRSEQGFGGRTSTSYRLTDRKIKTKITFGGEFQQGYFGIQTYGNRQGNVDTLQFNDEVAISQYLVFSQVELDLPEDFFLTLGGSFNQSNYSFTRLYKANSGLQNRYFSPVFLPRIALLKKIGSFLSVFGSVASGFSAPTNDEIRPSTATFNTTLNPEKGLNYEIGFRGNVLNAALFYDVTGFIFQLNQTIVGRRAADGADFFVNAGKTNQKGVEVSLAYTIDYKLKLWTTWAYSDFRFKDYQQNTDDFSGNQLTGVAPHVFTMGFD
ncbi:MAG: TonB-dependent receptor, partial [Verrucomicrobia bacterium]|nr:TonB-dependent receptor [Cytophagales bacterium]